MTLVVVFVIFFICQSKRVDCLPYFCHLLLQNSLYWVAFCFFPIFNIFIMPFAEGEIDYVKVLNRVLPNDIRILGWCPVPSDFHARLVYFICNFFIIWWSSYKGIGDNKSNTGYKLWFIFETSSCCTNISKIFIVHSPNPFV